METSATLARTLKGIELATTKPLRRKGELWIVPSASGHGTYVVDPRDDSCTCPDHEENRNRCKHSIAVEYKLTHEVDSNGATVVTETLKVTKKAWPQDHANESRFLAAERRRVPELLRALVDGLDVEPRKPTRGQPPLPVREALVAILMKVYYGASSRRTESDLAFLVERGILKLETAPTHATIDRYMAKPEITEKLQKLLVESARPLAVLEEQDTFTYGADATGFATSCLGHWFEDKHGKRTEDGSGIEHKRRKYLKAHVMAGMKTHIVTSLVVTDGNANDCPFLPTLLNGTKDAGFNVQTVVADKGYLSEANFEAVAAAGATPYIPFKTNSTGNGSPIVKKMFGLYVYQREEFLKVYHQRSNVETVFSMVKRRFGDNLVSKDETAQKNELLGKFVLHNLTALVRSIYMLGVDPVFWAEHEEQRVAS